MRAPDFWTRRGPASTALMPLSLLWRFGAWAKSVTAVAQHPGIPVICVGNLIAGGAGKTPVTLALAEILRARGHRPAFLTRGHGGHVIGPHLVNPNKDDADAVGDEPLLLARFGSTWVSRHRGLGAQAAKQAGAEILLLDDGLQNPTLRKDMSFIVVDGGFGFGNGRMIPAGPMRESLTGGLKKAVAVIRVGADQVGLEAQVGGRLPILSARLEPDPGTASDLIGKRVVAFAGIGRPEKFYETLRGLGAEIAATREFADHEPYSQAVWAELRRLAEGKKARLVTTEKDWMRLKPFARPDQVSVLAVTARFDDPAAVEALLMRAVAEGDHG